MDELIKKTNEEANLVAGAAILGDWRHYKPVFYRLYYESEENSDTKRKSLLVVSKTGFLAVATGLAHVTGSNNVILSLITPISLITIGNSEGKIKEIFNNFPREFCNNLVSNFINNIAINNVSDRFDLITYIRNLKYDCIVVKKLIKDSKNVEYNDNKDNKLKLPTICNYKLALNYEEKFVNKQLNLDLNLIVVPNNITVKTDDFLVIFREKHPESSDMDSILKASILEGLVHGFVEKVGRFIDEHKQADITVFYDTTHGINALLPPFSSIVDVVDPMVDMKLASTILQERDREDRRYSVRSYIYNSGPISLRGGDEKYYLDLTFSNNISYYYRILTRKSILFTKFSEKIENKRVRKYIDGLITRMVKVRSTIDELMGSFSNLQGDVELYLIAMYFAKLGLFPWVVAISKGLDEVDDYFYVVNLKINEKNMNNKAFFIEYEDKYNDPYTTIASFELGKSMLKYIRTIYDAHYEGIDTFLGEVVKTGSHNDVYITLESLKKIMKNIEEKMDYCVEKNCIGNFSVLLATSLYQSIIEPSAKAIILSEIKRLEDNLERTLHLLFKGILQEDIDINNIINKIFQGCSEHNSSLSLFNKDTGIIIRNIENKEDKYTVICFDSQAIQPNLKLVRNFIAHGGFTRLLDGWCLIIKPRDGQNFNEESLAKKCEAYGVYIYKLPSSNQLRKIIEYII